MVILDVSIVNVALPSIHAGLHFSTTGLQWVVNAYTLTFAGFLLLGGRAADLLGRRRVFLAGTAAVRAFLAVVRAGRLARSADRCAGAAGSRRRRALAGHALDHHLHRCPRAAERNRGLGAVGRDRAALGASSGALLGGMLTQAFGWPAIFAVNVPLGVRRDRARAARDPGHARGARAGATSTSPARCS